MTRRPRYNEGLKRMSLTLPTSLYDEFVEYTKKYDLAMVEGMRQAISQWIERRIEAEMIEGYEVIKEDSLALLEEFKYVDRECWDDE